MKFVAGYVPVIHSGYLRFFKNHLGAELLIFSREIYGEFEHLQRDIRALPAEVVARIVETEGFFSRTSVLTLEKAKTLPKSAQIVLPDEDISRFVAQKYMREQRTVFEPVFLRFDMPASLSKRPARPDRQITVSDLDREFMAAALELRRFSPDWWRQVGAVAVRDGSIAVSSYNRHLPTAHSLYAVGDPRGNFKPGEHVDLTCAHHAERSIIAKAARFGIVLNGASLYVTTFPCPSCAFSIVEAGFARIYYTGGYSAVEADEICRSRGVELVYVEEKN